MTVATICTTETAFPKTPAVKPISRVAGWLHALGHYMECRALQRQRAKALRQARRELRGLSDETLSDIGLRRGEVSTVIQGMLGPVEFWCPGQR
ncbi:DUF1127 domain-containing protein [Ferruginivarius sediminum]|uniref:DUF1127 domain-containing protein n=1 Tax=Ferruginivarius sediminum TaxID=2661937 RepID=A0A369TF61_9PROT|nr:DUF1127 domain-containing protein [Ferruginivarius sediminum]RDD63015.1 DUF1127 domain-containing protein [Ferruginivarius sediminum]